jgi:hypothetical protein
VGALKDCVYTIGQKMADFCGFSEMMKDDEGSYVNARQAREEIHTAGVLMHITLQHPSSLPTVVGKPDCLTSLDVRKLCNATRDRAWLVSHQRMKRIGPPARGTSERAERVVEPEEQV